MDASIQGMRDDLKKDLEVLRVRRRVISVLAKLPDDDARRRVIGAVGVLYGFFDVVEKRR